MSGPYSFQSQGERNLYRHLVKEQILGRAGKIQCQDHVLLGPDKVLYVADFKVFDVKLNEDCWYEYKCPSFETVPWIEKRSLWSKVGPGKLRIWGPGSYPNTIRFRQEISPPNATNLDRSDTK